MLFPVTLYRVLKYSRTSMAKTPLVGCFGFNGPLRQYFSLYRAVSQREGERGERTDESKNVQTTPTRTYCKRNRPLPYCNQNCRMPRHWKFTQHHRTTRPPPKTPLEPLKYVRHKGSSNNESSSLRQVRTLNRDIVSIFFNMKVCCVFSLESPH